MAALALDLSAHHLVPGNPTGQGARWSTNVSCVRAAIS